MSSQRDTRPAWVQHFEKNLQTEYNHTTPMSVEQMEPDDEKVELILEYDGGENHESYEEAKELLKPVAKMAYAHEVQMPTQGRVVTQSDAVILSFRIEPEWCDADNPMDLPKEILDVPTTQDIYGRIIESI